MKFNRRLTRMGERSLQSEISSLKFQIAFIQPQARLYLRFCVFIFVLLLFCGFCATDIFAQSQLEALADSINRGNAEQKRNALFQIRNLKTAEASRIAIPALSDKSEIVRASAAPSVVFLSPDEAVPLLLPLLQRDKSVLVRKEAAYALGKTRNAAAVPPLVQVIQRDKIQEVKDAAAVAFGEIGDVSAIDVLTQILRRRPRDEEEFFRRAAARSIGQIAQIIQTSETRTITPENFLPDELKKTTKPAYRNLSATFPPFRAAVPVLIQLLQNPRESDDARREAAFALGTIGDASAIPVLQANANDKDYYLAEISREALQKLSKPTE